MKHLALSFWSLVLVLLASAPAFADTYTYTYTGNPFTSAVSGIQGVTDPYSTSDFATGSITLSTPLGPALSFATGQIQPLSATFSDGIQTLDTATGSTTHVYFFTDGNGNIIGWDVIINGPVIGTSLALQNVPGYGYNGDFASTISSNYQLEANNYDPGTWSITNNPSVAATPEPSSLLLLGTSLLGSAGILRRRLLS